jgi:glycosyltransferase involved in cell wall biosynthesis
MGLRVLHVVDSLAPEVGSIAISLRGLFRPLAAAGVTSTVLVSRPTSAEIAGADVQAAGDSAADRLADADLVHFHGCDRGLVELLLPAMRSLAKPYVVSPLGALSPKPYEKVGWFERLRNSLRERPFYRSAACLTVLGERERQDALGRGVNKQVRVLPYGIEIGDSEPPRIAPGGGAEAADERRMLLLCPIDPIEGIVPMLRAVADLGRDCKGWTVTLAGPEKADWRSQLEAAILRKGFSERITFVVDPDEQRQQALLAEAAFLAAPSFCVRPPVSVLQAIVAGVPVLASDHGCFEELAGHMTVCEPSRERLREAARTVINTSEPDRTAIARGAFEFARASLSWDYLAPQYASLYSEIAAT